MSSSEARIDRLERRVELLLAKVEAQAERIAVLETENTKLRADNADLRRRLGENSSNSNKPPSSDRRANARNARSRRPVGARQVANLGTRATGARCYPRAR